MKKLTLLIALLLVFTAISAQDDPLTIWSRFNTDDPGNISDEWLVDALAEYTAETGVEVENAFNRFDEVNAKLSVAVTAGGEVPDLAYVDPQFLTFYERNGILTDLTEFVENAEWYGDLEPLALEGCTTPEGTILCVPTTIMNFFHYYWVDAYPGGFPANTDAFLAEADAVVERGFAPITFRAEGGTGFERMYYGLLASNGAALADEDGRAVWANEEAVEVVEFLRTLFAEDYATDVSLAPGFEYEEPFKRGEAGGFVAGSQSYVYMSSITGPDGTVYEQTDTSVMPTLAIGEAIAAGQLELAPPLAFGDSIPVSMAAPEAWAIPTGSEDMEGAMAFIDFQMTTARSVAVAVANGQAPALTSAAADPIFADDPYWNTVNEIRGEYGILVPAWEDYDGAIKLLADAILTCLTDMDADIMAELTEAQDEYNLLLGL